jgi:8-amino-7-oxononanoate synthase
VTTWPEWVSAETAAIRAAGRWRTVLPLDARGPSGRLADGRSVVGFASNDYLGLSAHPVVVAAAHEALDRWGSGSGASRLVVGSRPVHHELEAALADWKQTEAALLFPTGYAANLSVLSALAGPGVTVYSDELNHASIVDGCRLAKADVTVYPHRDVERLSGLMSQAAGRALVVTDTVFSMDGDVAPLGDLLSLCSQFEAALVLDEAHAVLGPDLPPVGDGVDVLRVGTLSKSLGSLGGFVAASRRWIDLLINRARPFIFTTAPSPADTAAALAALDVVRSPQGSALVARLRENVALVRPGHPSPIVPLILGDEQRALDASAALLARGLLVPAIRPPTVAPGTSRLRVALSAAHSVEQVGLLVAALGDVTDPAMASPT